MRFPNVFTAAGLGCLLFAGLAPAQGQGQTTSPGQSPMPENRRTMPNQQPPDDQAPAPDNTKVNERDRSAKEPTADQAKNNASDREIMKKIRRSVMDDKTLSTYAHNVKIVARNGKVTLKGPVRSEDEKRTIEQKAVEVAGAGNVTNDITIKAARSGKTTGGADRMDTNKTDMDKNGSDMDKSKSNKNVPDDSQPGSTQPGKY